MGGCNSYLPLFLVVALILCYAFVSIPSNVINDNPIRYVSDSPNRHDPRTIIEAIYQFGDSISDTGNVKYEDPQSLYANLPYGQTFFHKATGRCSDGLLMIDYFTEFLKLPFLDPYLDKDGNFTHGVNFAVAGSTALNSSTLAKKDIYGSTNSSLLVQLDWFKSHLDSICSSASECKEKLTTALILMGETGGNDYNWAFIGGKSLSEVYKLVPDVVQVIKKAIKEVINLGATRIIVPGNFPIGCMTCYLDMFKTNDTNMYDELRCLKDLNTFAEFHNNKLIEVIGEVQKEHPNVAVVYADYVSPLQGILRHATSLGFDKDVMQDACCGNCGTKGATVCEHPYKHVSWDGVHLTQHAYQIMAEWLIEHTSVFHESASVTHSSNGFFV